jgi:glutamyl-tRNA synthetase
VDDRLMGITHVLRGDEWLSSTPRHVLLYQAFGWEPPAFVHLPMILGPDKAKLSKRHGDTSVLAFRDHGFLPEALSNFLGLLGWSLDDHTEIIDRETFVRHFTLDRVLANPAVFNREKLEWMNGVYIRSLSDNELAERLAPVIRRTLGEEMDRAHLLRIVPYIRERMKLLREVQDMAGFLIDDRIENRWDRWIGRKSPENTKRAATVLRRIHKELSSIRRWEPKAIERRVREVIGKSRLDSRVLLRLIREAITDRRATPPLFESMWVLGRKKTLRRLKSAIDSYGNETLLLLEAAREIRSTTAPATHHERVLGRKNRKAVIGSQTSPESLEGVPETETRTTNRTVTPSPFESEDETEGANLTIRSNQEPLSTEP